MRSTDDFQNIMRTFLALALSLVKMLRRYDQYSSYKMLGELLYPERWQRSAFYE